MKRYQEQIKKRNQLKILRLLEKNPLTYGEIKEKLGFSDPVLSQHIKELLKSETIIRIVRDEDQKLAYVVNPQSLYAIHLKRKMPEFEKAEDIEELASLFLYYLSSRIDSLTIDLKVLNETKNKQAYYKFLTETTITEIIEYEAAALYYITQKALEAAKTSPEKLEKAINLLSEASKKFLLEVLGENKKFIEDISEVRETIKNDLVKAFNEKTETTI